MVELWVNFGSLCPQIREQDAKEDIGNHVSSKQALLDVSRK